MLLTTRAPVTLGATSLSVHGAGGWTDLGRPSGAVPKAPETRRGAQVDLAAGSYDAVRLGHSVEPARIEIRAGMVAPVLLVVGSGGLEKTGVYAGNDDVSLGLAEAGGKYVPFPDFNLVDQNGRPVDRSALAGHDVVLAAFHTTCHETCPLYTGLFLQLQRSLPAGTVLVEVTTDPLNDTPSAMRAYASAVGANWTFLTGPAGAVGRFWQPLQVQISSSDQHISTLALIDRHGFLRAVYRGIPNVRSVPVELLLRMSPAGLAELGHGDGWGAPQVLDALRTITGQEARSAGGGGQAPAFSLAGLAGGQVSLAAFAGHPVVLNFWATYCPPCRAELPAMATAVKAAPGVQLVLVNERDDSAAAAKLLSQLGISAPVAIDGDGKAGALYGVTALPTTVFIRADGTIEGTYLGATDGAALAPHLAAIEAR